MVGMDLKGWSVRTSTRFIWQGRLNAVAYLGILFGEGGFQQIQLRTENRENGALVAVAPKSGGLEAAVIWYKKFHFI